MDVSLDDVIAKNKRGGGRGGGRGRGRGGRGSFNNRDSFAETTKSTRGRKTLKSFKTKNIGRNSTLTKLRSAKKTGNAASLLAASQKLRQQALLLLQQQGGRGRGSRQPGRMPSGVWTRGGSARANGMGDRLQSTTKIQISNLDFGVSDDDIKELFSEFGAIRKAFVAYDASGRSQGTAEVVYERRSDAMKAISQYNGMPLDGRPMKIETVGGGGGGFQNGLSPRRSAPRGNFNGTSTRGRGGSSRGRGGGAPRGGSTRVAKPTVTSEDLDKELDAYISKN